MVRHRALHGGDRPGHDRHLRRELLDAGQGDRLADVAELPFQAEALVAIVRAMAGRPELFESGQGDVARSITDPETRRPRRW